MAIRPTRLFVYGTLRKGGSAPLADRLAQEARWLGRAAARGALVTVEQSARDALVELRQLLETLRTPDADTPTSSTLSLRALPDLVAHAADNGLPTTFAVVGEPVETPELVQVNLYRIAQEALTNARRHGGPDAVADVRLRYDDAGIGELGPDAGFELARISVRVSWTGDGYGWEKA